MTARWPTIPTTLLGIGLALFGGSVAAIAALSRPELPELPVDTPASRLLLAGGVTAVAVGVSLLTRMALRPYKLPVRRDHTSVSLASGRVHTSSPAAAGVSRGDDTAAAPGHIGGGAAAEQTSILPAVSRGGLWAGQVLPPEPDRPTTQLPSVRVRDARGRAVAASASGCVEAATLPLPACRGEGPRQAGAPRQQT